MAAQPAELPKEVWINKPVKKVENGSTDMSREIEIVCPGRNMGADSAAIPEIAAALP